MVSNEASGKGENPRIIHVSKRFLFLSFAASCLSAYAIGHWARIFLIVRPQQQFLEAYYSELGMLQENTDTQNTKDNAFILPDPILQAGKTPPITTYTSKNFNTAKSSTTHSRWMVMETPSESAVDEPAVDGNCDKCRSSTNETYEGELSPSVVEEEEHLPAGQHLLIDIEHVDSAFLNSEERLATAMLDLVNECGLTLLSYHCHSLLPSGVSCAGVLLESHVSFHTWPTEGVITLDLFTCGPNSLLPIVPLAEELFAIPSVEPDAESAPKVVWAHKYRGFGREFDHEITDMFKFPVGIMNDYKQEITSIKTDFQTMDVYDVLRPGRQSVELYQKSLSNDGSYESLNPELFAPDRIVFLDGVLQSCKTGDAAYHEALVHPAMFAHEDPKRVAIVGGGEGATLREVLKHNTVEKVIMIDIDEKMVEMSKKVLPYWSDCSNLKESTKSCFDDPRVETYYLDAFKWFIDRYGDHASGEFDEEPFDVIIMDAL